jgi:carbon monoxide dehydrogenase subunit G
VVHIQVERTIAAPPDQVFDWLADPANLRSAPLVLRAILAGCAKALQG